MAALVDPGQFEKFGKFTLIDNIVKAYPAYTHDDVFLLEYDFAMMLLMMAKEAADYQKEYNKAAKIYYATNGRVHN